MTDKETRRQGDKKRLVVSLSPCLVDSLSVISLTPWQVGPRRLGIELRELLDQFAAAGVDVSRHDDFQHRELIAAGDAQPFEPQLGAAGSAGRDGDRHLAS